MRGYELDDGSYIIVNDDELEALEPQKTREIELREFVELSEVAPAFLERGYYLTPAKRPRSVSPAGGRHGKNAASRHRDLCHA